MEDCPSSYGVVGLAEEASAVVPAVVSGAAASVDLAVAASAVVGLEEVGDGERDWLLENGVMGLGNRPQRSHPVGTDQWSVPMTNGTTRRTRNGPSAT